MTIHHSPAAAAAVEATPPPPDTATTITLSLEELDTFGDAWHGQGEWRGLAGRIVLQWRDTQVRGPWLLAPGGASARAALRQAVADAEADPPLIESSSWADSVFAFRVRSVEQLRSEFGLDDDEIADDYADGADTVFEEVDSDGIDWHPSEPDCPERKSGKHRWVEGQAYGHGAGIQRTDECRKCGLKRHEDTWATDWSDGSQGNHRIAYEDADGETLMRPGVPA